MNQVEALDVLREQGAVLDGHFRLSSGRHSDVFAQKFRVLERPGITQRFGAEIARLFENDFDVVASPAVGAVVLGFATALAGDARFIFSERVDGEMVFRRGFQIAAHERVLVVEDVVTTGGSAREVVELVDGTGGTCVGIGVLLDRKDAARPDSLGAPLRALVQLETQSWEPEECPLCARGVPITDPGSRRISS